MPKERLSLKATYLVGVREGVHFGAVNSIGEDLVELVARALRLNAAVKQFGEATENRVEQR